MRNRLAVAAVLTLFLTDAGAHDTFLKFERYRLNADSATSVVLMNGTFDTSESNVTIDRLRDARITGPDGQRIHPEASQWQLTETASTLYFDTGKPGTYAVGASIKPRVLEMAVEAFERYLKNDGVVDVLEARQSGDTTEGPVAERYSKHVKALFQVGDVYTDNVKAAYGYPIEIVPLVNPFALEVGERLPVQVLFQGAPLSGQYVYASYESYATRKDSDHHEEAVSTRTDANGIAEIPLLHEGRWYVRLIHMSKSDEPDVDYESHWATLTFEIQGS